MTTNEITPGIYKNQLGARLKVSAPMTTVAGLSTLGPIYSAQTIGSFFPAGYYVTPAGLRDAGFEREDDAS